MQEIVAHKDIQRRAKSIASKINKNKFYKKGIVCIVVLKGGVPWAKDVLSWVSHPVEMHYIVASSYHGTVKGSKCVDLNLMGLNASSIRDNHVIVFDDVYDSGRTFNVIGNRLLKLGPNSLVFSVSVIKNNPCNVGLDDFRPSLIGFELENDFLVGYGMDVEEHYRNLRGICKWEKTKNSTPVHH